MERREKRSGERGGGWTAYPGTFHPCKRLFDASAHRVIPVPDGHSHATCRWRVLRQIQWRPRSFCAV